MTVCETVIPIANSDDHAQQKFKILHRFEKVSNRWNNLEGHLRSLEKLFGKLYIKGGPIIHNDHVSHITMTTSHSWAIQASILMLVLGVVNLHIIFDLPSFTHCKHRCPKILKSHHLTLTIFHFDPQMVCIAETHVYIQTTKFHVYSMAAC